MSAFDRTLKQHLVSYRMEENKILSDDLPDESISSSEDVVSRVWRSLSFEVYTQFTTRIHRQLQRLLPHAVVLLRRQSTKQRRPIRRNAQRLLSTSVQAVINRSHSEMTRPYVWKISTAKIVARVKPTEKLESDDKTVPLSPSETDDRSC